GKGFGGGGAVSHRRWCRAMLGRRLHGECGSRARLRSTDCCDVAGGKKKPRQDAGASSTPFKRDYFAAGLLRSEVVGSRQAYRARCGVVGAHAVGLGDLLRAHFVPGIALYGLQLIEDVEDVQAEGQLMVSEGRTVLDAQIQALGPRLAT